MELEIVVKKDFRQITIVKFNKIEIFTTLVLNPRVFI